jgi:hypothetical protein
MLSVVRVLMDWLFNEFWMTVAKPAFWVSEDEAAELFGPFRTRFAVLSADANAVAC